MEKKLYIYMEKFSPSIHQLYVENEEVVSISAGGADGLEEQVIKAVKEGYKIILNENKRGEPLPLPKTIEDKLRSLITNYELQLI